MNRQSRSLTYSRGLAAFACLSIATLTAIPASAITIVGEFIGDGMPYDPAGMAAGGGTIPFGGAAPGTVAGGGSFTDLFDAAASWWEQAIADEHTITIQYGWGPRGDSGVLATAFSIGSSPQPAVYGKIVIDNDGTSDFFSTVHRLTTRSLAHWQPLPTILAGELSTRAALMPAGQALQQPRIC